MNYIQNGNETWYILKSIYVEKAPIIVFKNTDRYCWCQEKLSILQKCPDFYPKECFFNYIALNENKATNNYLRPFNWDLLKRPLTEHSILKFSLFSADVS